MPASSAPVLRWLLATLPLVLLLPANAQVPKKAQPKAPPVPPVLPETAYVMQEALPGVFPQALAVVTAPGDAKRLFVVAKTGKIHVVTELDTTPKDAVFLDLTQPRDGTLETSSECGVLGLAFQPDHAKNRQFFVYYSLKINGQLHQRVSRFLVSADNPNVADLASEQPLFSQSDPAGNHNGGDVLFGPDGYLYVSTGDGGAGGDTLNQGRFIDKGFHAAILRIDVDKKPGSIEPNTHPGIALDGQQKAFYAIPADNPFIGATSHHGTAIDPKAVRTEIWACGFRNPWRMAFDPKNGRLFTGDVGQNLYEEIDIVIKGGDYGWSYREGLHEFPGGPGGPKAPAGFKPVDPIYEYPRTTGLSVTGGVVYHGQAFPELQGAYMFAEYSFGRIIALREKNGVWKDEIIYPIEPGIAGIGVHPITGEVLFANLASGKIRKLARR